MRISNTNYKNTSYDKARARCRIEMRIGKLPRTARVKDLESAIIIRNEWLRKLTAVFLDTSSEPPVGFYGMPPHLTCSLGWCLGPAWGGGVVLGC